MTGITHQNNLAARIGGWSARHRKAAVLSWLGFVLAAVTIGMAVGSRDLTMTDSLAGDSATAQRILDQAGLGDTATENVLIQSSSRTVSESAFQAAIRATIAVISSQKHVSHVRSPLDSATLVSADRHSALVTFEISGQVMDRAMRVGPILDAVAATERMQPGFRIAEFGSASFGN